MAFWRPDNKKTKEVPDKPETDAEKQKRERRELLKNAVKDRVMNYEIKGVSPVKVEQWKNETEDKVKEKIDGAKQEINKKSEAAVAKVEGIKFECRRQESNLTTKALLFGLKKIRFLREDQVSELEETLIQKKPEKIRTEADKFQEEAAERLNNQKLAAAAVKLAGQG
jgi:hypothetical protein